MDYTLAELRYKGIIGLLVEKQEYPFALWIVGFIVCAIAAYLLGSLNFALLISRIKFKGDIRNSGSGNAGMTNMMRTYGRSAAGFTLLGDAVKAFASCLIGTALNGELGMYVAGLFCIIGHVYPLYFGFKGGKGVVTTAALVLCINPIVFLILLIFFVAIVAATKYISLGSILCMTFFPMLLYKIANPGAFGLIVAVLIALFVIILHRGNIKRLCEGKENKFAFKK